MTDEEPHDGVFHCGLGEAGHCECSAADTMRDNFSHAEPCDNPWRVRGVKIGTPIEHGPGTGMMYGPSVTWPEIVRIKEARNKLTQERE